MPKFVIYIDANVYLDFYVGSHNNYRELLKTLHSVAQHVFVTKQIVNEVDRNKITVFVAHTKNYENKNPTIALAIPELLESKQDPNKKGWADRLENANTELKSLHAKWAERISKIAKEIAENEDAVTASLEPIFKSAAKPSQKQIESARQRKELGNPPGKKGDTLGDQLSWEQLLSHLEAGDNVWLVSKDGDFYVKVQKNIMLRPPLHKELKGKIADGSVHCFDDLLEALKHFNEASGQIVQDLPDTGVQEKITEEVPKSPILDTLRTDSFTSGTFSANKEPYWPYQIYRGQLSPALLATLGITSPPNTQQPCPSCGSTVAIFDGSNRTCSGCGQRLPL